MGRKHQREEWRNVPPLLEDLDYNESDFKRDVKGTGSQEDSSRWLSDPVLPVQSHSRIRSDAVARDAGEASAKLRSSETNPLPSVVHEDDVNVVSAADGDASSRPVTNPRYRAQARAVGDLVSDGHGFLDRKLGSQFQRILKCDWCSGPIPVDISPVDWPCECGSDSDDPAREYCGCAGCLGYRQALESGYAGKGRPPKYCSERHTKDAKNARKKAERDREKGVEVESGPVRLEPPPAEPEREPDPALVEALQRLMQLQVQNYKPVQGCAEPPELVAAFRSLLVAESSAERRRQVPLTRGGLDGSPWERARHRVRAWWPQRDVPISP